MLVLCLLVLYGKHFLVFLNISILIKPQEDTAAHHRVAVIKNK